LIPFVEALYDGGPFLQAVPKALTADGIFLCQVGEAPGLESPAEEASVNRNRAKFFSSLIKLGFQGTRAFEEVGIEITRVLNLSTSSKLFLFPRF